MSVDLIYRASTKEYALRQGEIVTGVVQYKPKLDNTTAPDSISIPFQKIVHPYSIIVSQDCDLDWDYDARHNTHEAQNKEHKLLNSILLCEVDAARSIKNDKNRGINRKEWNYIQTNRHERYHFFQKITPDFDLNEEGLPELTLDFKRIFGIGAENLYFQIENGIAKRRSVLNSPYLEHFSIRYHFFHQRVALPAQIESIKEG
ncbi:MAG: hypothetical protein SAJ37_16415 [Oscillatoria sp. PMC 1068.18]|nr:hypothetical protein [Oscillatoria sp. PMC 1068.18]